MSVVDDEWESFLSQGAIILSNEKNSAKNNVTNSYQKNMDSTMTSYTAIIDTNDKTNAILKSPTSFDTETEHLSMPMPMPLSGLSKPKHSKKKINVSSLKIVENNLHSKKNTIKAKHCTGFTGGSDDEMSEIGELEELEDIDLDDYDSKISNILNATVNSESETRQPVCSNIYISTKTKISYLNEPIDIKKVFWNIPISEYSTPDECIIKKQIKVSTTDPKELEEIRELLKHEKYYQEQEIEHIDNPEGRIKFKVQLKINIGLCKKDILNYRCKLKRAFFNCFVLIMRIRDQSGEGFK
jgi:hypothetical protein